MKATVKAYIVGGRAYEFSFQLYAKVSFSAPI